MTIESKKDTARSIIKRTKSYKCPHCGRGQFPIRPNGTAQFANARSSQYHWNARDTWTEHIRSLMAMIIARKTPRCLIATEMGHAMGTQTDLGQKGRDIRLRIGAQYDPETGTFAGNPG